MDALYAALAACPPPACADAAPAAYAPTWSDASPRAALFAGPLGSGKTAALALAARQAADAGAAVLYLDLADPRLPRRPDVPVRVLDALFARDPAARAGRIALLLDNAEALPGWQPFAARLLDVYDLRLVAAAAARSWAAAGLARELGCELRAVELRPRPWYELRHALSFPEFLQVGGLADMGAGAPSAAPALVRRRVEGVVAGLAARTDGLPPAPATRRAAALVLAQAGGRVSLTCLAADLAAEGLAASRPALARLLAALEESYLVQALHDVSFAPANDPAAPVSPRAAATVYACDQALACAFAPGAPNRAVLERHAVLAHLGRALGAAGRVATCRAGVRGSVSFAVLDVRGAARLLVQVEPPGPEPSCRAARRDLERAMGERGVARGLLLAHDGREGRASCAAGSVEVVPLEDWLAAPDPL
jgi:predicted AAA+ superfamily ATPase